MTLDLAGHMAPSGDSGGTYDVNKKFPGDGGPGLRGIIGLPPSAHYEMMNDGAPNEIAKATIDALTLNSMPVMGITPCTPQYQMGLSLYNLKESPEEWASIVQNALEPANSLTPDLSVPIHVAFLNDVQFTESFSNDYGESMFERISQMGSQRAFELQQITGTSSTGEAIGAIGRGLKDEGGMFAWMLGQTTRILGATAGVAGDLFGGLLGEEMRGVMGGRQIDFPKIWRSSEYIPSYSLTVRLYNPFPGRREEDQENHIKYIIEPIAKLLALAVPPSHTANTYSYPLLCKVDCPGLFKIHAGYVSNIEIMKGGESNSITFHQQPAMVDIRITFSELYNTMVSSGGLDQPSTEKEIRAEATQRTEEDMIEWNENKNVVVQGSDPLGISAWVAPDMPKNQSEPDWSEVHEDYMESFTSPEKLDRPTLRKYIANMVDQIQTPWLFQNNEMMVRQAGNLGGNNNYPNVPPTGNTPAWREPDIESNERVPTVSKDRAESAGGSLSSESVPSDNDW